MTKAQLIKALETFDDKLPVFIKTPVNVDFEYHPIESTSVVTIALREEPNGKVLATQEVIELSEE